jgi:Reverse transcriptase (RNA-dependent DNA polymerase)
MSSKLPAHGRPPVATLNNNWNNLPDSAIPQCDSGATRTMAPHADVNWPLTNFRRTTGIVRTAGSEELQITGEGFNHHLGHTIAVRGLARPLVSTVQDAQDGLYTIFGPHDMVTTTKRPHIRGSIVREARLVNNRYLLRPRTGQSSEARTTSATLSAVKGKLRTRRVLYGAIRSTNRTPPRRLVPGRQSPGGGAPRPSSCASDCLASHDREYQENGSAETKAAQHSQETWEHFHGVFAHLGRGLLNTMIAHKTLKGLPATPFRRPMHACSGCRVGNFRAITMDRHTANRPSAPALPRQNIKPLELVSFDSFEVSRKTRSLQGNRYCTAFVDYGTDTAWPYFSKKKVTFHKVLEQFLNDRAREGRIVQQLRSDSEPINLTDAASKVARAHNPFIKIDPTPPEKPQLNGKVESTIEVICGRSRACLAMVPWLPFFLWECVIRFVCKRMNISANSNRQDLVPLQRYDPSVDIDVSRLKPFGTPCYYGKRNPPPGSKLKPNRGRFGYVVDDSEFGHKGYTVYDPFYKKLYENRIDVRFDAAPRKLTPIQQLRHLEKEFQLLKSPLLPDEDVQPPLIKPPLDTPAAQAPTSSPPPSGGPSDAPLPLVTQPLPVTELATSVKEKKIRVPIRASFIAGQRRSQRKQYVLSKQKEKKKQEQQKEKLEDGIHTVNGPDELAALGDREDFELKGELEELKRIQRQIKRLAMEDLTIEEIEQMLHEEVTAAANDPDAPLPPTPSGWDEALSGPYADQWRAAKVKEETGIDNQRTWVHAPDYKGPTVKSRWAFRVSREPDGSIKFRARIVAKGFSERRGIDYFETFAPTVSLKSLLVLLHLAASRDWEIRSIDIGNAYLEADLDTEIHMELPPEPGQPRRVVRLLKSLYGLKQAGELWNRRLDQILKDLGFTRCESDACVYTRIKGTTRTYICLYVDDLLTFGNDKQDLLDFEEELSKKVKKLTIKGDAQGFVGMEFRRDRAKKIITLTQTQYIRDVVHSEGLDLASAKATPAVASRDLNKAERGTRDPMRTIVGKIRYAVDHVHPEALFIASQLSSASHEPGDEHWKAASHCIRYLKGASTVGLTLGGPSAIEPEIYVDASYIEDGAARSQLGYCMRLNKVAGMIHCRSIRDTSTSLSASEAELRALKEATQEAMWLRYFLQELGFPLAGPTPVHEDNQAVINLITTLKTSPRTRHLNKTRHFIIQQAMKRRITVKKVAGGENVADLLTKNLEHTPFLRHRAQMLGEDLKV